MQIGLFCIQSNRISQNRSIAIIRRCLWNKGMASVSATSIFSIQSFLHAPSFLIP